MKKPLRTRRIYFTRRNIFLVLLFLITTIMAVMALLLPLSSRGGSLPLEVGDVAPAEIVAPRTISYESEVLTEAKRQAAADAVTPVYAIPNTAIARTQVNQLRALLTYINSVRTDEYATIEQKSADLSATQDINLSPDSIDQLLNLPDTSWQAVQQEAIVVLEQAMRSTIREDRLEDARRSVPALISLSLNVEQATLVSELVTAFVAPNSLYSETQTEARRAEVRQSVEPVIQTYVANEAILLRGQVVDEVSLEAMDKLGLLQPSTTWKDRGSVISIVLVCFAFVAIYLQHRKEMINDPRGLMIMSILFIVFLVGARIIIPNRTIFPYLFPIAAYSLLVSSLLSAPPAGVLALPLGILAAFGLSNSLELTLYYVLTSMFGVLVLKNANRITSCFWAAMAISASGAGIILAFRLTDQTTDPTGLATLMGATLVYAIASISLAIILQFFLAQTLGLTTTLELIDVSRPDHPLLQHILRNAPGTYQHSQQIANLAEQAAALIHADALLTRVGALYHDAGKARHPHFFIENQVPGSHNPHEDLSPQESAKVIIQHVPDGLELANKYKLPKRIHSFISEHHGTLITRFQYVQAIKAAGGDAQKVDIEEFRYPGPRPQSVETALVMLADGVEARARAERPENETAIRNIIEDSINKRLEAGQLDDTDLTLKEINTVIDSFVATLKGVYHPRILYPEVDQATRPREGLLVEKKP